MSSTFRSFLFCTVILPSLLLKPSPARSPNVDQRQFLPVQLQRIGGVAGTIDSEALRPALARIHDQSIYIYDYGDSRIKAFDLNGRLKWSYGRNGSGPGEFQNPTDLKIGPNGSLWVVDPANIRITIIKPTDRSARFIRPRQPASDVAPLTNQIGSAWIVPTDPTALVQLIDSAGRILKEIPAPDFMRDVHPLVWELSIESAGDAAVVSFRYTDRIGLTTPGSDAAFERGIERVEVPQPIRWTNSNGYTITRVSPQAKEVALSTDVYSGYLYVLFGGDREDAGSVVDLYRLPERDYVASLRLPQPAHSIAVGEDGLVGITRAEIPSIDLWDWEPSRLRSLRQ